MRLRQPGFPARISGILNMPAARIIQSGGYSGEAYSGYAGASICSHSGEYESYDHGPNITRTFAKLTDGCIHCAATPTRRTSSLSGPIQTQTPRPHRLRPIAWDRSPAPVGQSPTTA